MGVTDWESEAELPHLPSPIILEEQDCTPESAGLCFARPAFVQDMRRACGVGLALLDAYAMLTLEELESVPNMLDGDRVTFTTKRHSTGETCRHEGWLYNMGANLISRRETQERITVKRLHLSMVRIQLVKEHCSSELWQALLEKTLRGQLDVARRLKEKLLRAEARDMVDCKTLYTSRKQLESNAAKVGYIELHAWLQEPAVPGLLARSGLEGQAKNEGAYYERFIEYREDGTPSQEEEATPVWSGIERAEVVKLATGIMQGKVQGLCYRRQGRGFPLGWMVLNGDFEVTFAILRSKDEEATPQRFPGRTEFTIRGLDFNADVEDLLQTFRAKGWACVSLAAWQEGWDAMGKPLRSLVVAAERAPPAELPSGSSTLETTAGLLVFGSKGKEKGKGKSKGKGKGKAKGLAASPLHPQSWPGGAGPPGTPVMGPVATGPGKLASILEARCGTMREETAEAVGVVETRLMQAVTESLQAFETRITNQRNEDSEHLKRLRAQEAAERAAQRETDSRQVAANRAEDRAHFESQITRLIGCVGKCNNSMTAMAAQVETNKNAVDEELARLRDELANPAKRERRSE